MRWVCVALLAPLLGACSSTPSAPPMNVGISHRVSLATAKKSVDYPIDQPKYRPKRVKIENVYLLPQNQTSDAVKIEYSDDSVLLFEPRFKPQSELNYQSEAVSNGGRELEIATGCRGWVLERGTLHPRLKETVELTSITWTCLGSTVEWKLSGPYDGAVLLRMARSMPRY